MASDDIQTADFMISSGFHRCDGAKLSPAERLKPDLVEPDEPV
jgi:hypothetical protein